MPATRCHEHEIDLPAPPERVFALLHTPSAIRQWWGAARVVVIPRPGGVWAAAWGDDEDDPDYITTATMTVFDPPPPEGRIRFEKYEYVSKHGPLPFEADFVTEFTVGPNGAGSSILNVRQDGFPTGPEADDFYAACRKGWHDTFDSIRRYVDDNTEGCDR